MEPPAGGAEARVQAPQASALATMAAYIDLNAVRVGLVDDPKDYRYCGYAEALGGNEAARVRWVAATGAGCARCAICVLR